MGDKFSGGAFLTISGIGLTLRLWLPVMTLIVLFFLETEVSTDPSSTEAKYACILSLLSSS